MPVVAAHRTSAWGFLAVLVVATGLSFARYHGGWASPTTKWSTDIGDPEQMIWFLAWTPHALLRGGNPFFTTYGLYPTGANMMWNTSIILPALLLAPLTLSAGPVVSYNLLLTMAPALTAATSYLAFRRWVSSPVAAAVGGLAFGFCPFLLIQQNGHQQLSLLALLPLTLLVADEVLVRQRWRPWLAGGALGVLGAAQLLTGEEILIIEALVALVVVLTLCVLRPGAVAAKVRHAAGALAVAAGVFLVLSAVPLYAQEHGAQRPAGPEHAAIVYSTDLANFVQPIAQLVHANLFRHPLPFAGREPTAYLGIPLLLLLLVVVATNLRRRPIVPVAAIGLVVFAVLSLGPRLHVDGHASLSMPWDLAVHLPVLENLLPTRLTVAVDLFAALLVAVFVDDLLAARSGLWPVAGAGLLLTAVAFWLPAPAGTSKVETPRFFTTSAEDRLPAGSVAVIEPYIFSPLHAEALVWQAVGGMRFRSVEGYLLTASPTDNGSRTPLADALVALQSGSFVLTRADRAAILTYLHRDHVREVIVGPSRYRARDKSFYDALLGRPPIRSGGVLLWMLPPA